jgi:hypothetical protein
VCQIIKNIEDKIMSILNVAASYANKNFADEWKNNPTTVNFIKWFFFFGDAGVAIGLISGINWIGILGVLSWIVCVLFAIIPFKRYIQLLAEGIRMHQH